jgi:hypothetical protein
MGLKFLYFLLKKTNDVHGTGETTIENKSSNT